MNELSESTWPKIILTSSMLIATAVSLCVFFYYYMM